MENILYNCCTILLPPDWSRYISLEISGCVNDAEEGADETNIVGRIERDKAEFFCVYGRLNSGEAEAITDCPSYQLAEQVATIFAMRTGYPVHITC